MDEEAVARRRTSEIDHARRGFVAALRRGDVKAAASFYTADARLLAPSADTLIGPAAIARFWQAGLEAGVQDLELECERVDVEPGGALACEVGRYVIRLQPPVGSPVTDRGRYLLVHRRDVDGAWRRAVETLNPDADQGRAGAAQESATTR